MVNTVSITYIIIDLIQYYVYVWLTSIIVRAMMPFRVSRLRWSISVDVIILRWGHTTLAGALNLIWPVSSQEENIFCHRKKTHEGMLRGMRDSDWNTASASSREWGILGALPGAKRNRDHSWCLWRYQALPAPWSESILVVLNHSVYGTLL